MAGEMRDGPATPAVEPRGKSGSRIHRLALAIVPLGLTVLGVALAQQGPPPDTASDIFQTADACMACHNGITTPAGEDVSIGAEWRASMMANSARDPYWHAAVRREVLDHPEAAAEIQNECATCHMPMASFEPKEAGRLAEVFAHLPVGQSVRPLAPLAADGVSCTVCHQITDEALGDPATFNGRFRVDTSHPWELRRLFGPFEPDSGRLALMRSATAYTQTESSHIQQSELCASCHTLYTHVLAAGGDGVELPEQVPYLEWQHSAYREEQSCQGCHMPVVADSIPIASVLGQNRAGFSRHSFRGGNFFMLRMLNRYRDELGTTALPQDLDRAALEAIDHLQSDAARLTIERLAMADGVLRASVHVQNLAGHKLPTAYPSRRAWLHVTVYDAAGRRLFESGRPSADGSIDGNDNDAQPDRYEPHYATITGPDQVQIYEAILGGPDGEVTTGLLTGVRYLKDNRILPRGFDKRTADEDIAVYGAADRDPDFSDGADAIEYRLQVPATAARIEAELWYQPIGYRWAENLKEYRSFETDRFTRYFDEMSEGSAIMIARTAREIP